jgi:nucleoside 2-deoxyribosyltransferase
MRQLKVYLAAPYVRKDEILDHAIELRASGITVTSSWLDEPHKPTTQMHELTHEEHQAYALADISDVVSADVFVFFTDPSKTIVRAGRHVEFGIALGLGLTRSMPIFVVGQERENIFHHCPQVYHFDSWFQVKGQLVDLAQSAQE